MSTDPLDDNYTPGNGTHECEHGWVQVKEPYARHLALSKVPEESAQFASLYASLLNSFYPCRVCRPVQFYRWATKHYEPTHDVSSCAECIEAHSGKRRGARVAAAVAGDSASERVRRDLDS